MGKEENRESLSLSYGLVGGCLMSSRLVVGLLLLAAGSVRAAVPPRGPDTVAGVVNKLKDEDPTVRLRAARDLGNLGAAAREAVPQLMKALRDPAAGVRS